MEVEAPSKLTEFEAEVCEDVAAAFTALRAMTMRIARLAAKSFGR
jgi:hypothetical protein